MGSSTHLRTNVEPAQQMEPGPLEVTRRTRPTPPFRLRVSRNPTRISGLRLWIYTSTRPRRRFISSRQAIGFPRQSQQAIKISGGGSVGKGGPMKGCTTKSKGAPTRLPLKEWAPWLNAEEEVAAGVAAGGKPAAAKNRMPKDHVKWILAQKPLAPPARYAALKRSNPDLTPRPEEEVDEEKRRLYVVAKAFYEMEERFPKLQEWVREELETKGYVEVTDEWLKDREELNDMIDREWPKIQAKLDAIVLKQTSQCEDDENYCHEEDED